MVDDVIDGEARLDRRKLVLTGAGAIAAAGIGAVWPAAAKGEALAASPGRTPPPSPIPGGVQIPDGPQIHIWLAGTETVKLPYSGSQLQGLNVDPSTITNFDGTTAHGLLTGSAARGNDGKTYNVEVDIRGYKGRYVAADGSTRQGVFALI